MKQKIIAFTVYDKKNAAYAEKLQKSFHHFHPDIPLRMFNDTEIRKAKDPDIFYKQKPYFADKLFREGYDVVLGLDADMIVLGKLDYLFDTKGYDVGTVLNYNPVDFKIMGPITVQGVHFTEYYNAGLVLMRNHAFVKQWLRLCQSKYFARFQFREQDLLNILAHFGTFQVKCFDDADPHINHYAWHGVLGAHETSKTVMENGEVVIKASKDGFPTHDIQFKVWHPAGGQTEYDKLNYRTAFPEEVVEHINNILK